MNKPVFLCAISNISSGSCAEDCGFCTQSARHHAHIDRYYHKPLEKIIEEAKRAHANKALGFCLVTSGKGLDDKKLSFVCETAHAVRKALPDLNLIACNGLATLDQLKALKEAGVFSYNHNLETSREFYDTICTTHSWDERFATCMNAKEAGLMLCSGGIYGLGESKADHASLQASLKELDPMSTPINFFIPNPALPISAPTLTKAEACQVIFDTRVALPHAMVMVAGGRSQVFGDDLGMMFEAGANAVVIGDYLTTKGGEPHADIAHILELGYVISQTCHE